MIDEAEDCGFIRHGEGGIGGGASVSEVVGVDDAFIVLGQVVAKPIGAVVSSPAGEGWVAEWVLRRGLGPRGGVAGLGVRVAEGD